MIASRSGPRRRTAARGFTLVELMIVLVIFGIVSALAVPGFNKFMRSVGLNSTVNTQATKLRVMRQRAITESNTYRCWYDSYYRDWGWWDDDNNDFMWQSTEVWGSGKLMPPWLTVWNDGANPFTLFWLNFEPNGSANQSGSLIYINSDGYWKRMSVIRPTGMVTVQ